MEINISCNVSDVQRELRNMSSDTNRKLREGLSQAGELVKGVARANAPVDTGTLRRSINKKVQGNTAIVGTNVEYAIYQEFGTYKMKAHPFMAPALEECRDEITEIIASKFR